MSESATVCPPPAPKTSMRAPRPGTSTPRRTRCRCWRSVARWRTRATATSPAGSWCRSRTRFPNPPATRCSTRAAGRCSTTCSSPASCWRSTAALRFTTSCCTRNLRLRCVGYAFRRAGRPDGRGIQQELVPETLLSQEGGSHGLMPNAAADRPHGARDRRPGGAKHPRLPHPLPRAPEREPNRARVRRHARSGPDKRTGSGHLRRRHPQLSLPTWRYSPEAGGASRHHPAIAGRSAWADALAALTAAAQVLTTRFGIDGDVGRDVAEVPVWQVATAVSDGRLLSPGWPAPTHQGGSTPLAPASG